MYTGRVFLSFRSLKQAAWLVLLTCPAVACAQDSTSHPAAVAAPADTGTAAQKPSAEAAGSGTDKTDSSASESVIIPPLPSVDTAAALKEGEKLRAAFRSAVGSSAVKLTPARQALMIRLAKEQLQSSDHKIDRAQLIVIVDRSPAIQRLALVLALPDQDDWPLIGASKTSTGTAGRKYYYITPTGIFENSADRLGYRAEGTKNKNGIRGIGAKGMRVWDFGWHNATKGWSGNGKTGDIRLEMHATDPDFLESRLGRPASEGCVRIPARVNVFFDQHGVLDAEYEQTASYDARFRALLPKNLTPTPVTGDLMVVVDSTGLSAASGYKGKS
ncbi:L,D-transpeptidase [Acetobacter sp. AN02]|uniref:L,D-transpeptidase n=1 Tax=Acetobacter sp. AN02 TaxID=2894186 RepID=UPI0024341176|nr:L,D-transpeptidase [Acetobacter sp. AN02]MDG6095039.1 L,D-transpeptidase [Acetobacter sp. AN02]